MSDTFMIEPRRVLTTDDADDRPRVLADATPPDTLELNGCRMHRLWQTDAVPASLPVVEDVTAHGLPPLPETFAGTRFYTAEIPGGASSPTIPLHRSDTIDYIVVVRGEIVLRVGETDERVMRAGDCLVQLGATHTWENRSDEPCLLAVVVVGAHRHTG